MQAVLILAHKNIDQVIELASRLSTDFEIYIHLDKKANITVDQSRKIKKLLKVIFQNMMLNGEAIAL